MSRRLSRICARFSQKFFDFFPIFRPNCVLSPRNHKIWKLYKQSLPPKTLIHYILYIPFALSLGGLPCPAPSREECAGRLLVVPPPREPSLWLSGKATYDMWSLSPQWGIKGVGRSYRMRPYARRAQSGRGYRRSAPSMPQK